MSTITDLAVEFSRHNDLKRIAAEAMARHAAVDVPHIEQEVIEHAVPDART